MDYSRVYHALMDGARGRPSFAGAERHHIQPRALGGTDAQENLVWLAPREHYVAHYLLWKLYRTRAMARAFTLMARMEGRATGRGYESAKAAYAQSMRGDANVARRPSVRRKLSENNARVWAGRTRPEHSALMKAHSLFTDRGFQQARAAAQRGAGNPLAVAVRLRRGGADIHFDTITAAAERLGVTIQAVKQAMDRGGRTRGWVVERAV